ncbi:vacuolar protein sorting-associated protein 13B isoform X2 [Coccinella septempunctata]|uniref:vacuolar protein sorting-associated protein 13B isoform X2 n=1 Tax=Coccinella septempunctata TaxID=41139 RepID=UPI001D096964|nr:vacuolar protein sorting-associated protein 13B isoform X2 [Coccinella septempunctata]
MFKIESYITPILLSYVDKYIKNFRLEDSTVSLWGGDACFHNLDLRLEVLEQELHLPVSFVSGHIRELLIHVPWTKLASEPITVTINTIECILKLRGSDVSSGSSSSGKSREKLKAQSQDLEAPPGYLASLIHKIVGNIRIYCNNLILKYVEEDIVLSMNIKHFKFESANEVWEPSFTEALFSSDLGSDEVKMRKLICINDLTICLDKRNAAGKIEVYQEPMLYKCSMTMHLLRTYHSASASRSSTTRLDIYCNSLEFGMSEQQLPMFIRLILLCFALKRKKREEDHEPNTQSSGLTEIRDNNDNAETWTGWAWSYVSSVLSDPTNEEWMNQQNAETDHILHIGFYVDKASVIFKVTDASRERNYYQHKKLRYMPVLALELQGIYSETITHGPKWLNSTFGISEILLSPLGYCSCSVMESPEGCKPIPYLRIGSQSSYYKFNSLFDADALENKGAKKHYNNCWDYHLINLTESVLLERTPAFAVDYIHEMAITEDLTPEKLTEMTSNLEYSNLPERDYTRIFIAPLKLRLCSGFHHRISSMIMAAINYEYVPYYIPAPDPDYQDLLPPSEEDFDALNEFIPLASVKVTFFAPVIEFETADHPHFVPKKGKLYRKHKKVSAHAQQTVPQAAHQESENVKLVVEFQCLDLLYITPFYVNRLVYTTCQLPDPPKGLFDACFKKFELKVLGLTSRLVVSSHCQTTILLPFNASFMTRQILKPQYWTDPNVTHFELTIESENLTLNGTKAKMLLIYDLIMALFQLDGENSNLQNSSIMTDACRDAGFPYMELYIEGIRFKKVTTYTTVSLDMSLDSIKAFIFETFDHDKLSENSAGASSAKKYLNENIQQILFISGPEPKHSSTIFQSSQITSLFTATIQYPINPDNQVHPTIVTYNIQEIRICVDPLVFKWFLYKPQFYRTNSFANFSDTPYKVKSADSSVFCDSTRKSSMLLESVHSSSDREKSSIVSKRSKILKEEPIDMQEKIYNFLRDWFNVWKSMIVSGEISQCTIYFPMVSLSAVGSQGIQEAVNHAVNKKDPPDIMVIKLPNLLTHCTQRQNLKKYMTHLPISLPETIWSPDRSCFPWTLTIKDLSCYTIQNGSKMDCLKPCSLNATIGLSTKNSKPEENTLHKDAPAATSVSKHDISSLGVCVHVDMTPVLISTCEIQVYLFASILYGLVEIASSFVPSEKNKHQQEYNTRILESIDSKSESIMTIPENPVDQQSQNSSSINLTEADQDSKLTAWLQWTITKFTIELNSMTKESRKNKPKLKLVIDTEDIVSSIDFQNVYLKIKSKVGSMSVEHFKLVKDKWQPGPYSGLVMRHRDDYLSEERHEDNAFINLTITRASCRHTHTLWGTLHRKKDLKLSSTSSTTIPTRFITEIVVSIKPTDFILSFKTLRNFNLVLEPLFAIQMPEKKGKGSQSVSYVTNQALPLAYLECHDVRVIIPVSMSKKRGNMKLDHDVYMLQISKISLCPSAVNPICRTPYRPDLYQHAARSRILNIPGSEMEDRQYQLDIIGTSLNTGAWADVELILNMPSGILTSLHGSSENPAVEWNNLEKVCINSNPSTHLWAVLEKIDLSIITAPAMVYRDVLVCCNSVEVNIVSDVAVSLCLCQIKLALYLFGEFNEFIQPVKTSRKKIRFPYSKLVGEHDESEVEALRDSGIESSEFKSVGSSFKHDIYRFDSEKHFTVLKSSSMNIDNVHPLEVLLTGGKISLSLYRIGSDYPVYNEKNAHEDNRKPLQKIKETILDVKQSINTIGIVPSITKMKNKVSLKGKFKGSKQSLSETISEEEFDRRFIPLCYVLLSQPNLYILDEKNTRKVHFCLFNISMKISGSKYSPTTSIPTAQDYHVTILETLAGMPHPETGIPPAFLTVKVTTKLNYNSVLDVDFARPTRILCSKDICYDILGIQQAIMDCIQTENFQVAPMKSNISLYNIPLTLIPESSENYIRFQEIKTKVFNLNTINITSDQLVLIWETNTDYKLRLTVGKIKNNFSLLSRPDKVTNFVKLECVSLLYESDYVSQLVLNPWTIAIDLLLYWESWQYLGDNPQSQIIAESDSLMLTVCPERLEVLNVLMDDIIRFVRDLRKSREVPEQSVDFPETIIQQQDSEQYYKDDLRAGAFQFVDSTTDNIDEMPLPYQVMFWNKNIAAMAWRYPQPRCLTKVRVFPVPLKVSIDGEYEIEISCSLEYWSECHASFITYTQFVLPEDEILHLELPKAKPHPPFACVWRVELTISRSSIEDVDIFSIFSPHALAACMRIDSYFNRSLIPDFSVAFSISRFRIALNTKFDKERYTILPPFLKGYNPDMLFPSSQCFSEIIFDSLKLHSSSWNFNTFLVDMTTSLKVLVLEYAFLTMQPMIDCSGFKFETSISKRCDCNFISKSVAVSFSPSIAHTLAVSAQLWNLNYSSFITNKSEDLNFCVLTRYIICNDTNTALKFGQNDTDEEIMLMPRYFNLYCWRTQKQKQQMRVSLEGKEWLWSQPFSLEVGTQIVEISEKKKLSLNLTVIALSATQLQVVFSGQLIIANMLSEHFELKIVRENVTDNRKIVNQVVAGNSMTTSMVINYDKAHFLRLRFYGLETSWSGDIPLMEHAKSAQPWLVKVPLMERGQFLSVWCRVVVQDFSNGKKILAMLWPLFSIKSNLPISTKVHIETPLLNYHGDIMVKSHGEEQQLYCPGTIDHSHQLTFQLENVAPSPNPYVPLNYSLIDHDTFFRRMDKVDINDIIEYLKTHKENEWPYFGEELNNVEWVVGDQPETHVQVKYHNSCEYSSTLMVELLPWCLLVNICGCMIGIKMEGEEVCTLQHNGIVTPPKIEDTFNILIYINDEKYTSDPLQFAKPATWSQNFYMPKILGIIPADGTIVCNVKCKRHISRLSIRSYIVNDIRLLKIASTHVLCNNTRFPMYVICLAVPSTDMYAIPDHSTCNVVTIPSGMYEKNQGVSILQWFNLEEDKQSSSAEHVLYMVFSLNPALGWSKPIRVDEFFVRKTISLISETEPVPLAITSFEGKSQNFISVHHDTRPQIYIENNSGVTLYCAQSSEGEGSEIMEETEHFKWFCEIKDGNSNYYSMMSFTDKFPDIPPQANKENLVFAKDPLGLLQGSVWSSEINLADDSEQYVKIPFHGDVRIFVKNSSCLTYIKVESVSKVEINAKDIRSRLLQFHELSKAGGSRSHNEPPKIIHSFSAEAIKPYEQEFGDVNYQTLSTSNMKDGMSEIVNFHPLTRRKSDSQIMIGQKPHRILFCSTIPMLEHWDLLNVMVFVNNFTFTLLSDIDKKTADVDEITSLICDNIAISTMQSDCMEMELYVQNIQVDNQLYSKRNYDFPVVMLMQEPVQFRRMHSLDVPIKNLFDEIRVSSALKLSLTIDTWVDPRNHKVTGIQELTFSLQPFSCYLEDTYLLLISEYLNIFMPTNLIFIPESPKCKPTLDNSLFIYIPDMVLWQSAVQAHPLTIRRMLVDPISVMLSVHSSIKMYLALDQSPLLFAEFERKRVFTNAYRLGHTLTMHYLSGAIFRAGWMVSSLEILGSPVGLARAMGSGLKDFVALPFRGLLQGPVEFLYGVTHGSASLMKHVTAGTLQSFTKMASSVARNLDYLTLDEEHVKRAEEQRRQRPAGVTEGLMQGLTGLGISILGAIGGIAHHPLQSVIAEGGSPRSLAAGLGLGLVGIITKPLSGAAELLALTGQGLLQGAGWNNLPEQRNQPILHNMFSSNSSILKYDWKMNTISENSSKFLHMTDATSVSTNFQYASVALIITNKNLIIVNADEDVVQNSIILSEVEPLKSNSDPTLLSLELVPTKPIVLKVEDDVIVEMDPASRARVADYVKNTVGMLQVAGGSKGPSEMSISPLSSPGGGNDSEAESKKVLSFYVNPQDRNYFLCLLAMAKHENLDMCNNYPVL